MPAPLLVFSQGDPAGVGPEILVRTLAASRADDWLPLGIVERSAVEALEPVLADGVVDRLQFLDGEPTRRRIEAVAAAGRVALLDPVSQPRTVRPGHPGEADAAAALAALELAAGTVAEGPGDALITLPVSKASIARHVLPEFRGHTDHLARLAGLERYGRDYLMAFLAAELQVALLTVHLSLAEAIRSLAEPPLVEALRCLNEYAGGRVAVAGLNPHAGEEGLLGDEEERILAPAIATVRREGIDVHGPVAPDTVFARARRGEFDWVLALYHDQGLIAVKTVAFGAATNWTLGLPYLRTSVDHGTAFDLAGRGVADLAPLEAVIATTLRLADGRLPRGRPGRDG